MWHTTFNPDGSVHPIADWWSYAELDQYGASLAVSRTDLRPILKQAQGSWLQNFVDHEHGGVWTVFDLGTNAPVPDGSKHWEWKAGFHAFEHALVSYLSASAVAEQDATLYFAIEAPEIPIALAYGFQGDAQSIEEVDVGSAIQRVTVSGLRYLPADLTSGE